MLVGEREVEFRDGPVGVLSLEVALLLGEPFSGVDAVGLGAGREAAVGQFAFGALGELAGQRRLGRPRRPGVRDRCHAAGDGGEVLGLVV